MTKMIGRRGLGWACTLLGAAAWGGQAGGGAPGGPVDAGVDGAAASSDANSSDAPPDVCQPMAYECHGQQPQQCNGVGTGWLNVGSACSGQACVNGGCVGTCMPGATRCSGADLQTCDAAGAWSPAVACAAGEVCDSVDPPWQGIPRLS